jgi:hypothetical protein
VIVLEADYLKTESSQLDGTPDVLFTATMLAAVNFDDQLGLQADEISDKTPNRVLSPESEAADLALAKSPPEYSLGADRLAAHRTRSRSQKRSDMLMRHWSNNRRHWLAPPT